jgi:hypothetical protein
MGLLFRYMYVLQTMVDRTAYTTTGFKTVPYQHFLNSLGNNQKSQENSSELYGEWSKTSSPDSFRYSCTVVDLWAGVLSLAHLSWKLKWAILIARCPLSVCPSVRLSVCKLLHFRLLLQNHWANFNQTWNKSSLGGGDSKLFKWRGLPFSKGR